MSEFKYNNGYKEVVLNEDDMFKISCEKEHLSNKKIDYHTLMLMTLFSSDDSEETCNDDGYVYTKRDVLSDNLELVEDISNKKINSIFKTINKIKKADTKLITSKKGCSGSIVYKIYNNCKCVEMDSLLMKDLISNCSNNAIKIYILLRNECGLNKKKISRSWILENIGLNKTSGINLRLITETTNELHNKGYINKETIRVNTGGTVCYYEINNTYNKEGK